jgi:hypothetical protein
MSTHCKLCGAAGKKRKLPDPAKAVSRAQARRWAQVIVQHVKDKHGEEQEEADPKATQSQEAH